MHPADYLNMRTSVNLPDETAERFKARADEAGISQSEWLRRVIDAACTPDGYPATTSAELETVTAERDQAREDLADAGARIASLTAAIAGAEAEAARLSDEATAARLELETATADRLALVERAARADGLAAARLEELERVRSDLERERDGRRRDLIETAAGYVRTALPSSSTTADQDPGRPGILASARARVRAFMAR